MSPSVARSSNRFAEMREGIQSIAAQPARGPELDDVIFPAFFALSSLAVESFAIRLELAHTLNAEAERTECEVCGGERGSGFTLTL